MPDGTLSDVTINRLSESNGVPVRIEIKLDLNNLSNVKAADLVLQPGDNIQINRSFWASMRDAFGVIVSAAIVTTAVSQVIVATR